MIGRITPRKLNADTDDRSLSADEMKKAINIAVDSDSEGDGGVVKFSDGNTAILPSDALAGVDNGVNTVIGSVSDEELGVVYFFVHNSLGNHGVYAYSSDKNTYRKIFSSPTLDFDQNGFVKGDIVRIKRQYELEAPQIIINQGEDGGAVVDTGTGGGPVEPIGELTPDIININVGRDLYPLIELDANLMDIYGSDIGSTLGPVGYEAVITGSYTPAGTAARATSEPVVFYESADLDLNLNPEGVEEIVAQSVAEGLVFNATTGKKSIYIELDRDVFVHPDVTVDGVLDITVTLRPMDPTFKIQAFGQYLDVDYTSEVSNASMSETIVFTGVVGSASSVGSDSDNHPVIKTPGKTRVELTVGDVYGDTYLTYTGVDGLLGEQYLLDLQKKLLSCRVNESSSPISINYEVEADVVNMKLVDRTIPVKVRIDYENSPSYQAFKSLWAEQQNANTSDVYDVPINVGLRSSLRVPDDTTTNVVYYTFCPFSMAWSIVGMHPSSIPYENADGSFRTYSELVGLAQTYYAENSGSVVPWVGNTGPYSSISAVYNEINSGGLGDQWDFQADGTFPNWIAVQIFVGGTTECPVPTAEDVFNPVLVVAPVVQDGETKYKQPRVVAPYSWPGQYLSGEDALDDLASDASFVFVVDIPMAVHHGSTATSTEEYDFVLVSYNNSDFAAFVGVEDVVPEAYDAHVKLNEQSGFGQAPIIDLNSTVGDFNEGYDSLQVFSDGERQISYPYSISGDPSQIQALRGRRIRVTPYASDKAMRTTMQYSMFYELQYNNGSRFTGVVLTPFVIGNAASKEFCFGFGTECANTGGLLPPKDLRIPDAPVITQGDVQEDVGGDTATDEGGTTTTTDTTKPTTPESSTLSLPTKDTSTTTKETIKKKY